MKEPIDIIKELTSLEKGTKPSPEEAMKLIGPFYTELNKAAKELAPSIGLTSEAAFIALRDVIIKFIFLDGSYEKKEYEYYAAFCHLAHFEPRTPAEIVKTYSAIDEERLAAEIEIIRAFRSSLKEPKLYRDFTDALWILVGLDHELSEVEYDLLCLFYEKGLDVYPATYRAFLVAHNKR
jgi:hypothetical protein